MPASLKSQDASTTSPSGVLPRLHLGYLDGLRACAALLVIFHHAWMTAWPRGSTAPGWTLWLAEGHTIPIFMVLSGFCLMLPVVRGDGVLRGGGTVFLQKRARRILPTYYCAIGFSLLFGFLFLDHSASGLWAVTLPLTWNGLFLHLLLLQNFSGSELHTINYVFWFLSLEWWIYFFFPGLIWVWKRLGPGLTTTISVATTFALWRVCIACFHNGFMLYYAGLFVLGMFGTELAYTRRDFICTLRDRLPWTLMTWTLAGLILVAMTGKIRHFSSGDLIDVLVAVWTMCLLVALSTRSGAAASRLLSQKWLVFVGSFAYSLYLVHAPLLEGIWQYVLGPLHLTSLSAFFVLELGGTLLIVAFAHVFHLIFERPFMTKPGVKIKTEAQAEVAAIVNPAP